MNILAIDTSCDVLSLALHHESALTSPKTQCIDIEASGRHSELLLEWIDRLFKNAEMEKRDLGLVTCMKGPGSFTGLRIGFAAAKGLSLALGIPLTAIPTLDCMAYGLSIWPGLVLTVIDAKKNCFFAALYRGGERLSDYLDLSPEAILSTLANYKLNPAEAVAITGPGAELFLSRLKAQDKTLSLMNNILIDPLFLKGRALELLQIVKKNCIVNGYIEIDADPLYIRKSDAELRMI
jgi:tRNA threonylcarbamoyladenosine biosynthesis protein TsaB